MSKSSSRITLVLLLLPFAPAHPIAAQDGTFKVKSNAVQVDVTVVDSDGNPVLDLTADDFEVLEDGKPQTLTYFSSPPPPRGAPAVSRTPDDAFAPEELSPTNSGVGEAAQPPRRFLLLMGNIGDDYFESIEKLAEFVLKLGPTDEVALMAFRRVGEFTNDHEKTAAAIRNYAKVNDAIDSILGLIRKSSLRLEVAPPSKRLPESVRKRMLSFFEEAGMKSRELPEPVFQNVSLYQGLDSNFDSIRISESKEALAGASVSQPEFNRPGHVSLVLDPSTFSVSVFEEARRKLFSDYPNGTGPLWRDIAKLDMSQIITAIEHLSFLKGEKLLFFLNDRGLDTLRDPTDPLKQIGHFAATSRVRLFLFQTGGMAPVLDFDPPGELLPPPRSTSGPSSLANIQFGFGLGPVLALSALKILAHDSGGAVSIHAHIDEGLRRVLQMSDQKYELAYLTSNDHWDGRFREIEVRVKRDGVKLSHRRGYVGEPSSSEDERRRSLTLLRTVAAMKQAEDLTEIPLAIKVARRPNGDRGELCEIHLEARLTERSFHKSEGAERSKLALVYFLGKSGRVRTYQDDIDLVLGEDDYQDALENGFNFVRDLEIPEGWTDADLKVVVFEPENDLLGSIATALPSL